MWYLADQESGIVYESFVAPIALNITILTAILIFIQNILLQQLGVAPFSEGPWPLYVHSQSLSVLSRLLLIWQHKAKAQGDPDVPECMKIWER